MCLQTISLDTESDAKQPEDFIWASLGIIQSSQEINLAAFCSHTCRMEGVVGSSFLINWPLCPLVQE